MQCEALEYATSNVVGGALLRLSLVTASRQGIVKREGASLLRKFATASRA